MTLLLILLTTAGVLSTTTIVLMLTDGRGLALRTPPASHAEDPTFLPPGARV